MREKPKQTFTIPLLLTSPPFRGAIVLAPFFGPARLFFALLLFAVADLGLGLLLIAPCAMVRLLVLCFVGMGREGDVYRLWSVEGRLKVL